MSVTLTESYVRNYFGAACEACAERREERARTELSVGLPDLASRDESAARFARQHSGDPEIVRAVVDSMAGLEFDSEGSMAYEVLKRIDGELFERWSNQSPQGPQDRF